MPKRSRKAIENDNDHNHNKPKRQRTQTELAEEKEHLVEEQNHVGQLQFFTKKRLNNKRKTTLTNYVVFNSLLYKSVYSSRHKSNQKGPLRRWICATTATNCKGEIKTEMDQFHSYGKEHNHNCKQISQTINTCKKNCGRKDETSSRNGPGSKRSV